MQKIQNKEIFTYKNAGFLTSMSKCIFASNEIVQTLKSKKWQIGN